MPGQRSGAAARPPTPRSPPRAGTRAPALLARPCGAPQTLSCPAPPWRLRGRGRPGAQRTAGAGEGGRPCRRGKALKEGARRQWRDPAAAAPSLPCRYPCAARAAPLLPPAPHPQLAYPTASLPARPRRSGGLFRISRASRYAPLVPSLGLGPGHCTLSLPSRSGAPCGAASTRCSLLRQGPMRPPPQRGPHRGRC